MDSKGSIENVYLEKFTYDDEIVRKFTLATLIWALVAMLAGVFIAIELVLSALNMGIKRSPLVDSS